MRSMKSAETFV